MNVFTKIKSAYEKNKIIRVGAQLLLFVMVIMSVRAWQAKDNIQGAAPIVVATTLSGDFFDLRQHQSKPVLIHFWASWCPICEFENPSIASIAKDYQVITIASWSGDAATLSQYLKTEKLSLPVIVDEDGEWAKMYGVRGVPASFIIDGKGNIQFIETGYTSESGLRLRLWWLE